MADAIVPHVRVLEPASDHLWIMAGGSGMPGEGTRFGFVWSASRPRNDPSSAYDFRCAPLEGGWFTFESHQKR